MCFALLVLMLITTVVSNEHSKQLTGECTTTRVYYKRFDVIIYANTTFANTNEQTRITLSYSESKPYEQVNSTYTCYLTPSSNKVDVKRSSITSWIIITALVGFFAIVSTCTTSKWYPEGACTLCDYRLFKDLKRAKSLDPDLNI